MSTSSPAVGGSRWDIPAPGEIVELSEDVSGSPYFNHDVAPTRAADRKWGTRDMAALWIGMSACIPSYQLASGLIAQGMNWKQALGTIVLGNLIILVPLILNAHAGTRYGIPFPVYCRASFGILGANIAAMIRAMVACGWFGIQTWIGGLGLYVPLIMFKPELAKSPAIFDDLNAAQIGCFLVFWLINMYIIWRGYETIRRFMNLATPILIIVPIMLLIWAYIKAGGLGPILSQPSKFAEGGERSGEFWSVFGFALTGCVGFWSTLALNIPDFSRFAKSQKAQAMGQTIGLPTTMALYAFIGVFVTSATLAVYHRAIWSPFELMQIREGDEKLAPLDPDSPGSLLTEISNGSDNEGDEPSAFAQEGVAAPDELAKSAAPLPVAEVSSAKLAPYIANPIAILIAVIALAAATLTTNIAANVVGPANDFSNLWPKHISFKMGALITGVLGIFFQPWLLVQDPSNYFQKWLVGYSAMLGAVAGILIIDYFVIRNRQLHVDELFKRGGRYWYTHGFNPRAIIAMICGVAPCVPGFIGTIRPMAAIPESSIWIALYHFAWFISFAIAALVFLVLSAISPPATETSK